MKLLSARIDLNVLLSFAVSLCIILCLALLDWSIFSRASCCISLNALRETCSSSPRWKYIAYVRVSSPNFYVQAQRNRQIPTSHIFILLVKRKQRLCGRQGKQCDICLGWLIGEVIKSIWNRTVVNENWNIVYFSLVRVWHFKIAYGQMFTHMWITFMSSYVYCMRMSTYKSNSMSHWYWLNTYFPQEFTNIYIINLYSEIFWIFSPTFRFPRLKVFYDENYRPVTSFLVGKPADFGWLNTFLPHCMMYNHSMYKKNITSPIPKLRATNDECMLNLSIPFANSD